MAEGAGRRRNAARTRRDILRVAGEHFARAGYAHVTLRKIAEDVGVNPGLIVRYFGSKRDLFAAVAQDVPEAPPTLPASVPNAEEVARAMVDFWQDKEARAPALALIRSLDVDDGELFRREMRRRVFEPLGTVFTGPDADLRIRMMAGIVMGFGFFGIGSLLEPDRPPLGPFERHRTIALLSAMIQDCFTAQL